MSLHESGHCGGSGINKFLAADLVTVSLVKTCSILSEVIERLDSSTGRGTISVHIMLDRVEKGRPSQLF